jgi:hypothetical protein
MMIACVQRSAYCSCVQGFLGTLHAVVCMRLACVRRAVCHWHDANIHALQHNCLTTCM